MAQLLATALRLYNQGILTEDEYYDMVCDIMYNFPDDRNECNNAMITII